MISCSLIYEQLGGRVQKRLKLSQTGNTRDSSMLTFHRKSSRKDLDAVSRCITIRVDNTHGNHLPKGIISSSKGGHLTRGVFQRRGLFNLHSFAFFLFLLFVVILVKRLH